MIKIRHHYSITKLREDIIRQVLLEHTRHFFPPQKSMANNRKRADDLFPGHDENWKTFRYDKSAIMRAVQFRFTTYKFNRSLTIRIEMTIRFIAI